jgi:hypothetical protein
VCRSFIWPGKSEGLLALRSHVPDFFPRDCIGSLYLYDLEEKNVSNFHGKDLAKSTLEIIINAGGDVVDATARDEALFSD